MPRANRYHAPGCIWHITHRCHKQEFLLKFIRDRRTWTDWLFEARKRYGTTVLNFMVTSNHVHLLVVDGEDEHSIPDSIRLIAGSTGQAFNRRKRRGGAFWEDRYHATAIESGTHLHRCMAYIDLNMCRNHVVPHPDAWATCGYHEIKSPPQRYQIIDRDRLAELLGLRSTDDLAETQHEWIKASLARDASRDPNWSESLAVGSENYVREIQNNLGVQARHRTITPTSQGYVLREPRVPYSTNSEPEMAHLRPQNTQKWKLDN
jgi:putative transposase